MPVPRATTLTQMSVRFFGSKAIFRPSSNTAKDLRQKVQRAILQKYSPGVYLGKEEANPILRSAFEFHDSRLRRIAPSLASRNSAEFLLSQYDEANAILHGSSITDPFEKQEWARIEPGFRRAIKFIVELFCIARNPGRERVSKKTCFQKLEELLCHAEHAADLAEISDRAYQIFPDDFQLILHAENSPQIFETSILGRHAGWDIRFQKRVIRDREARSRFMGGNYQFDIHTDSHSPFLDDAFSSAFGMSYGEFIYSIIRVIDDAKPVQNGPPTLFIKRSDLVKKFCEHGHPRRAVETLLRGFTVTANMLEAEDRVIWNPKQESRAYRRGFFSFPHEAGTHLAFSRSMAREALIQLVIGGCYRKLPAEWALPEIEDALEKLSKEAGDWFEKLVKSNLAAAGFCGGRVKRRMGRGEAALEIPPEVGELDFLGWNQERREVLLVEAKMTNTGIESRYWRNDLSEFVRGKKSYANQFRRKIDWVRANWDKIVGQLGAYSDCSFSARMVTLYPCIAAEFIDDFPCTSIAEMMLDPGY